MTVVGENTAFLETELLRSGGRCGMLKCSWRKQLLPDAVGFLGNVVGRYRAITVSTWVALDGLAYLDLTGTYSR